MMDLCLYLKEMVYCNNLQPTNEIYISKYHRTGKKKLTQTKPSGIWLNQKIYSTKEFTI